MPTLKKLASQTAIYGLSSILARSINFLLVPLYTGYMGTKEFGILTEYMTYIAFFIALVTFGMETTYFRYAGDKVKEEKIFSQYLTHVFSISSIVVGIILLFSGKLEQLLGESGDQSYIIILALVLFIDGISALPFARLRLKEKQLRFAIIKTSSILINVILNLLLVVYLPEELELKTLNLGFFTYDLSDKVYSIFIANLIANSLYLVVFFKDYLLLFKHYSKELVKPAFSYAYPIMILSLAALVNELIDRLMLKNYLSDDFYSGWTSIEALGVYGANYKFAIFVTLAVQAYRYAAEPFFFKLGKEKNSKETFAELMTVFTNIMLIMVISVSIFKEEIGFLILRGAEFRKGLYVVPILLFANLFVGVYYNLSTWYKLTDKTFFGSRIGIIGAIITIVFNFLLIPYFGFLGSAIATAICYFSMMAISYYYGQKYFPVPYEWKKLLTYLLVASTVVLVSHFIVQPLKGAILYKIMLTAGILFWMYQKEFKKYIKI